MAKKIISETPVSTPAKAAGDDVEDGGLIIPPVNKNANTAENMYSIDDIISFHEYSSLKELTKDMLDCDNDTLMALKEKKYAWL